MWVQHCLAKFAGEVCFIVLNPLQRRHFPCASCAQVALWDRVFEEEVDLEPGYGKGERVQNRGRKSSTHTIQAPADMCMCWILYRPWQVKNDGSRAGMGNFFVLQATWRRLLLAEGHTFCNWLHSLLNITFCLRCSENCIIMMHK